jgi:hypothetical protein
MPWLQTIAVLSREDFSAPHVTRGPAIACALLGCYRAREAALRVGQAAARDSTE